MLYLLWYKHFEINFGAVTVTPPYHTNHFGHSVNILHLVKVVRMLHLNVLSVRGT